MVRRVERFSAKLQVDALREAEGAVDAQVSLEETGTTQSIPSDRSKLRPSRQRPGTICGAVYSKHGIVEPSSGTWTTLSYRTYSFEAGDCRIKLVRHLTAAARQQTRRGTLNDIERQTAHDAHHSAHLETTKNRT